MDKKPWDEWDPEERKRADEQIRIADAIKLYRSAGGIGVNAKFAPQSAELEARGGMSPDEATNLARYRMQKELTGGDPEWQGPTNIPSGPRAPAERPEEVDARRDAFFAASPEGRVKILAAEKLAVDRSMEGFYDSLTKKPGVAETLDESRTKKKGRKRG